PLRRQPTQERGRRRVDQILTAAAAEFARVGYSEATTNAIAARAGVSIGSLYQFFPHKRALLQALAQNHLAAIDEITATALASPTPHSPTPPSSTPRSPEQVVSAVIDPVLSYCAATPGLAALLTGATAASETAEITSDLREALTARVAHLLSAKALTPERRLVAALVFVRILTALVSDAVDTDGGVNVAVATELKVALSAYLATLMPSPP
ncbi:MAG: TetR/AcrR family transcriptional regulator, partial [Pseudonocardiaceae bacterium]